MNSDVFLMVMVAVLFVITVVSLVASFKLRKKQVSTVTSVPEGADAEKKLDATFETCIGEINKMGTTIRSELDAKYKEILFLYSLIDEKQKEVKELLEKSEKSLLRADMEKAAGEALLEVEPENPRFLLVGEKEWGKGSVPFDMAAVKETKKPKQAPRFINEAHKNIWDMYENGKEVTDIAKELGIGQGEVKLILNIAAS